MQTSIAIYSSMIVRLRLWSQNPSPVVGYEMQCNIKWAMSTRLQSSRLMPFMIKDLLCLRQGTCIAKASALREGVRGRRTFDNCQASSHRTRVPATGNLLADTTKRPIQRIRQASWDSVGIQIAIHDIMAAGQRSSPQIASLWPQELECYPRFRASGHRQRVSTPRALPH